MPFDDFRKQPGAREKPNFDALGKCADWYEVSLMAAVLRWLGYTERRALFRPVGGDAKAPRIGLANRLVQKGKTRAQAIRLAGAIACFPQTCLRADRLSTLG